MVKINKYLILIHLFVLTLIGQSIIQCAARIQTEQSATNLDLELIEAATYGNKEKVKQLIEAGANVNAVDKDGWTALMGAAINGYKEIVELLIKADANVNATDEYKNTALICTTYLGYKMGYTEILELLIKANANINASDKDGCTALIYAARYGFIEIAELLLKAGSNIEHKNKADEKAINCAKKNIWHSGSIEKNKQEIVKTLIDEPARRAEVIKKWIKENLGKKITEATSEQLFSDISNIIAEYCSIEYTNIPLEYRLSN